MKNLLKWLVPSRHNHYHPHVLRPIGLAIAVFALLSVNLTYNLTSAQKGQVLGYATNISAGQIIALTNQHRANSGLGGLATNAQLTQAAQAKAQHMFAYNYWGHYAPDGTGPWYFITNAGYDYATAGENLAKDFDTSDGVVTAWMNSPAHRDNILNNTYRDIGIAAVNGTLQGSQTTLVVAMYGSPKAAPPAPAPAPVAPPPAAKPSAPAPTATTPAPAATPAPAPEAVKPKAEPAQPSNQSNRTGAADSSNSPPTLELQAVSVREKRNWAQNASLYIISLLFLFSVLKHTVVWRTQRRGWRHIWLRAHPLAQYALLLVAIAANLLGGAGVIL